MTDASQRKSRLAGALAVLALSLILSAACGDVRPVVRVGSKAFTESYILAEIVADVIERHGDVRVERKLGLGGTGVAYRAITNGDIDIYPEYTGTLTQAIFQDPSLRTVEDVRNRLAGTGLTVSESLGFNNTYALAVARRTADELGLKTISDLKRHPELTAAFTGGFVEREDGWQGLKRHYDFDLADVRTIEHALAYDAVDNGSIDVIDIYSTDGKLERHDLEILDDDRRFFPEYLAVLLVRESFKEQRPQVWNAVREALVGRLDDRRMVQLNARADLEGRSPAEVSAEFLGISRQNDSRRLQLMSDVWRLTIDHLLLVLLSLLGACLMGIPLGILAARHRRLGQLELMSVGVLQTIPSLALLCFMIPLFGIGKIPALVALFLYALLPIVRNTYTGLIGLDRQLLEIADVLGLSSGQRLLRIELPLASLSIMAGVKTSAVLTVGTATLAAFIGGGGYGDLIVRGLAMDEVTTILAGAVPAALMALLIHGLFEWLDRVLIPRGLKV